MLTSFARLDSAVEPLLLSSPIKIDHSVPEDRDVSLTAQPEAVQLEDGDNITPKRVLK